MSQPTDNPINQAISTTTTIDHLGPDGTTLLARDIHYFTGDPTTNLLVMSSSAQSPDVGSPNFYPTWNEGKEYQTDLVDPARGTLKSIANTFQNRQHVSWFSRGDVVAAKPPQDFAIQGEGGFEFDHVVDRGGHNTYRLLLRRKCPDDPGFTEAELLARGLAVEIEHGDFFAVDVPPSLDQHIIDDYLVAQSESGRWEMQDGYLHSIKTNCADEASRVDNPLSGTDGLS